MKSGIMARIIKRDVGLVVNKFKTKPFEASEVIVTGASGLIGTYLLAVLSQIRKQKQVKFKIVAIIQSAPTKILKSFTNAQDQIIRCDLTSHKSFKSLPKADLIIHAAGYGQPEKFLENPNETILLNTITTSRLIQKLNRNGRFLFISSSEVYSGLTSSPFTESQIGTTNPQHVRSCYIEGKRCGEAICSALSSTNNKIVVARLSLAYGPGTKRGDKRVINAFIEQAITRGQIKLLDSGKARRTYCYVTDAVEILLNIALYGTGHLYNVGGKSHTSIINMARKIGDYTHAYIYVPKLPDKLQGSPNNVCVSMKCYENEFGKKKYIDFDKGLKRTIKWQKELYK